jgi:hypothetical protein
MKGARSQDTVTLAFSIWEVARSSVGENPENLKRSAFSCFFCFDHYDSWWFHDVSWLIGFCLCWALSWRPNTRTPEFPPVAAQCSLFLGAAAVAQWLALWQLGAAVQLRIHQRPTLRSSEIGGSHHHSTCRSWDHGTTMDHNGPQNRI